VRVRARARARARRSAGERGQGKLGGASGVRCDSAQSRATTSSSLAVSPQVSPLIPLLEDHGHAGVSVFQGGGLEDVAGRGGACRHNHPRSFG